MTISISNDSYVTSQRNQTALHFTQKVSIPTPMDIIDSFSGISLQTLYSKRLRYFIILEINYILLEGNSQHKGPLLRTTKVCICSGNQGPN